MASKSVLIINDFDFRDYLAEGGIKYSFVERLKRSVVTLDGVDHRHWVNKDKIDVTLMDLPATDMEIVSNFLVTTTGLVSVTFLDRYGFYRTNVECYLTGFTMGMKKVYPGNLIYWSGIGFTLEQK